MAHADVFTASGAVKAGSGNLYGVNITKVATGTTPVVRIWDNPTAASGKKLYEGDGLSQQSFNLQSPGDGTKATQGLYCETTAGTSAATVVVIYD